MERYNLVVIGAGSGGLVVAAGAAGLGARVALIEKHKMGGDCLNYGCVPSKAFIKTGRIAHAVRTAGRFSVDTGSDHLPPQNLTFIMDYVRSVQEAIAPHDSVERFTGLGVEVRTGTGVLRSAHEVEIRETGERLRGRHIVIATGSHAAAPPIPGLEQAGYLTNETVFEATRLPSRLMVIGGGPIGLEIGQTFRRLGSEVTIAHDMAHILPKEDPDVAEVLTRSLEQEGIRIYNQIRIERVEAKDGSKQTILTTASGTQTVTADEIFLAAGRRPSIEGLGLEDVGVTFDRSGIRTDDRCRTSIPSIWAIGDVTGRYQFTHWAGHQARVVLRNTLFPLTVKCDDSALPWVTFTDPEVARVGLSVEEATQRNIPCDVYRVDFERMDRAVCDGETEGFARVLTAKGTGRILGAVIVHAHAGELIAELTLAMKNRITLERLSGTIHAYPTLSEVSRALGDACMRSRLKPGVKTWLTRVYAFLRR